MAHFQDLTPYVYSNSRFSDAPGPALNVGWLSRDVAFEQGAVRPEVVDRLEQLARRPVNLMRGSHICEFCQRAYGNGEIRVADQGTVYAAPVLVAHYMKEHGYRPPQAFIDAVLRRAESPPV